MTIRDLFAPLLAALLAVPACDAPDDAASFGADDELGEVELRREDLAIPVYVELSSIPQGQPVWPTTGGRILVMDDGVDPTRVYAYHVRSGTVTAVRHASRHDDLLRDQVIDLDGFPSAVWVAADPTRDKVLLETTVQRSGAGGNLTILPPKPVGPRGDDPQLSVKLLGFDVIAAATY